MYKKNHLNHGLLNGSVCSQQSLKHPFIHSINHVKYMISTQNKRETIKGHGSHSKRIEYY